MFQKILVPLDGSKRAERILPHVEALAGKFGAKLVLVSIVEPILSGVSPYGNGSYYIAEELERRTAAANAYLANLQETLSAKQLDVKTLVEYGPPVMALQDIAEREKVDLIAAPTTPSVAFPIGAHTDDPLAMYLEDVCTLPLNLAGLPGLVVPCGFEGHLPIGLQLIGKPFDESTLLRVGDSYQRLTDWHTRRPSM